MIGARTITERIVWTSHTVPWFTLEKVRRRAIITTNSDPRDVATTLIAVSTPSLTFFKPHMLLSVLITSVNGRRITAYLSILMNPIGLITSNDPSADINLVPKRAWMIFAIK